MKLKFLLLLTFLIAKASEAKWINADATNYKGFLSTLTAGDTLLLAAGNYTNNLSLNTINGAAAKPIVIMGSGNNTVFQGQSCCNTVSLTKCSYLVIKNLKLDGLNQVIDAVKAIQFLHHDL